MSLPHPSRARALVGALLTASIALTACGGQTAPDGTTTPGTGTTSASSPSAPATQDANSLLPPAEGKTQYPLILETPWGKTVLEKRPERVGAVAIDGVDTELLLALGVTPVTTSAAAINNAPWSIEAGADKIETVFSATYENRVPAETIAAAKPELLVALNWDLANDYQKLSSIAPVLGTPEAVDDYWATPWQEQLRWMGRALDLQDRAETVIADYQAKLTTIKDEHPEFSGKTATFGVWFGNEYGLAVYSNSGSTLDTMFQAIGFAPYPNKDVGSAEAIAPENYAILGTTDLLLIGTSGDTPLTELTDQEIFSTLPIVKDGRVIYLDSEEYGFPLVWALGAGQVLAHEWVLDQIVPLLAEKLG